ncbi:hypothetical protein Syun_013970 [Stephania yunnanensis]|uniref:Uncharacterized protein n=1 Tax=Stephania yunnanensis TaxID=152371 RepID=A0AAP0JKJ0_9MAGN
MHIRNALTHTTHTIFKPHLYHTPPPPPYSHHHHHHYSPPSMSSAARRLSPTHGPKTHT